MTTEKAKPKIRYTPGPYDYGWDRDGVDDYWYIFPKGKPAKHLAQIVFWDCSPEWMERTHVHARLFAAAPELLKTLKKLLKLMPATPTPDVKLRELAREAKILVAVTEGRK